MDTGLLIHTAAIGSLRIDFRVKLGFKKELCGYYSMSVAYRSHFEYISLAFQI